MEISLFEHNQNAYEAAMAMLFETGKAAVIHPTGTGKSFVGSVRNTAVRDQAERDLDALRRALEKADEVDGLQAESNNK